MNFKFSSIFLASTAAPPSIDSQLENRPSGGLNLRTYPSNQTIQESKLHFWSLNFFKSFFFRQKLTKKLEYFFSLKLIVIFFYLS